MRAVAIAFLGGILAVQQLADLPSLGWAALLLPAVLLSFWHHPRWSIVVFLIAGVVWATCRADLLLRQELPTALEGRDIEVVGVVADLPDPAEYGVRFLFDVEHATVKDDPVAVPARLTLTADRDVLLHAGDRWRFTVRLKRPHGFQNPGGFDYEAYLFRNGIRASGYVRGRPAPAFVDQAGGWSAVDRWRERLGEKIREQLPGNPYAGLIVALANGDTRGIDDGQWETLRRTGILHLVAISGMHISLITGLVYALVRFLWSVPGTTVLRVPAPLVGAAAGLLAACAYAALAGFVIPTQRALAMLIVAMGAVFFRRRFPPSQLLAMALLAVLAIDPLAVMAPGFWLSFAAVAVIIYVLYGDTAAPWWRRLGYLQWAIAIGMLPFMLWLFQQFSLIGPLANLFAVPVFDLAVVPLTLLGVCFIGIGAESIASMLFQLGAVLLHALWQALEWMSQFEFAQWSQHRPPAWTLVCALIGVVLLLAPRGWPGRVLGIVWLLPMFVVRPAGPPPEEVWFTVLDVGQGLAAVVRTPSHVLVYDAGARRSARFDAGNAVVVPYLRASGVDTVDAVLVSHGDNDHSGGMRSVLQAFPSARVLTGTEKIPGDRCRAGERWVWDGVEFAIVSPIDRIDSESNDGSCVLRIRAAHVSLLLPGDIEKRAEASLVDRLGADLKADILVAPHHGSRTSSTPVFLAAVRPRHVVFPVGYRNSYHHPHPTVTERYVALGAEMHDSPSSGAIEFRLNAQGIAVASYREQSRRYWFAR